MSSYVRREISMARAFLFTSICLSLIIAGCSGGGEGGGEGGGAHIPAGEVGSPCEGGDCKEGLSCYLGVPGGYCTKLCDGDCDDGVCARLGGDSYCMYECSSDGDCREGLGCADGVCRLQCDGNQDCTQGELCQGGVCLVDGVGAACAHPNECHSGHVCHRGLPDGYCTIDCSEEPCPTGATCMTFGGASYCFADCDDDEGCRDGYVCNHGTCNLPCSDDAECWAGHVCVAGRCEGGGVGQPCTTGPDCERPLSCFRGVEGGYCTARCGNDDDCPIGSACGSMKGQLWCLAVCRADIDCRDGQVCLEGMCSVPCEGDHDCADGFCDLDSGRCMGVGIDTIDLGDLAPMTSATFEVDESVYAFSVVIRGPQNVTYYSTELRNPNGDNLIGQMTQMGLTGPPLRIMPMQEAFTIQVPNSDSPQLEVTPGTWEVRVDSWGGGAPAGVMVYLRRSQDGRDRDGSVALEAFIAPGAFGPGVDASNAEESPFVQQVFGRFKHYYENQAGISIGSLRFHDLPSTYSVVGDNYSQMFRSFSKDDALNLFFIRELQLGSGGGAIGVSGGIPGPPRLGGTLNSGVTIAFMQQARHVGDGIAHEAGHFMGLFHTSEQYGGVHDLISDTPQCNPRDYSACAAVGATRNLMFPSLTGQQDVISPGQAGVLRANAGID